MSCAIGQRYGSDLALLWLWCRSAATAPNRPLAWESPYAAGVALKKTKKKKTEKAQKTKNTYTLKLRNVICQIYSIKKTMQFQVPVVAYWVKNLTSIREDAGPILSLAQWVKDLALLQAVV